MFLYADRKIIKYKVSFTNIALYYNYCNFTQNSVLFCSSSQIVYNLENEEI